MPFDETERFAPYKMDGLTIERDEATHEQTLDIMRKWLNEQREWFEPVEDTLVEYDFGSVTHLGVGPDTQFTNVIADHLSSFNGCPLKALKNKQKMQALHDQGLEFRSDLTEEQIVTFAMGYMFQGALMGKDSEVALWMPYSEDRLSGGFWFSPDAITNGAGHQIKTTRKSPSKKDDRYLTVKAVNRRTGEEYEKATDTLDPTWSIEKGLLEKFPFYWDYEKQTMYLFKKNHTYLTFWWVNTPAQATFKLTGDQEEIDRIGKELEDRIKFQRKFQEAGTLPRPDDRLSPSNCFSFGEPCPFLSEDPCLSRVPVLDLRVGV